MLYTSCQRLTSYMVSCKHKARNRPEHETTAVKKKNIYIYMYKYDVRLDLEYEKHYDNSETSGNHSSNGRESHHWRRASSTPAVCSGGVGRTWKQFVTREQHNRFVLSDVTLISFKPKMFYVFIYILWIPSSEMLDTYSTSDGRSLKFQTSWFRAKPFRLTHIPSSACVRESFDRVTSFNGIIRDFDIDLGLTFQKRAGKSLKIVHRKSFNCTHHFF
jgi:hypothetical protein